MANTVDLNEITEFFDEPHILNEKLNTLAKLIIASRSMTVFTGAGISTSAQIPDFRGPQGVWTCQAKGIDCPAGVSLTQATPTDCHLFIKDLVADGKIQYVTSQNIDGLHRRSGIPRKNLSELHGNCFLEVCWQCNADYERLYEVSAHGGDNSKCPECKARVPHFCHCTKRKCDNCSSRLKDSVIHFGENLPTEALELANSNAKQSDLCVVFGSSLRVSPACDIPKITKKKGGKLVIINLQTTPLDKLADIRIFAKTDEVCNVLRQLLQRASAPPSHAVLPGLKPTKLQLRVGNTHAVKSTSDPGDEAVHEWKVFVEASSDRASAIKEVRFTLHPTFSPNVISVTQPPFVLSRLGWGTFNVGIDVVVIDGETRMTHVDHQLNFDRPVTETIVAC
jgi:NAD-dependent SIR2 family protein deacetylase